jgi:4-hydroxybenzoyl-CoA thioesterase
LRFSDGDRVAEKQETERRMPFKTNERSVRIEWGDCDPAGIVYYPRYFAMFDASTTALFERALEMTKYEFLKYYRFLGYPMLATEARFVAPARFGDVVTIQTKLVKIGRSSFEVEHTLCKDGNIAVEASEKRVWTVQDPADPGRIKSQPIPDEVIRKLSS